MQVKNVLAFPSVAELKSWDEIRCRKAMRTCHMAGGNHVVDYTRCKSRGMRMSIVTYTPPKRRLLLYQNVPWRPQPMPVSPRTATQRRRTIGPLHHANQLPSRRPFPLAPSFFSLRFSTPPPLHLFEIRFPTRRAPHFPCFS